MAWAAEGSAVELAATNVPGTSVGAAEAVSYVSVGSVDSFSAIYVAKSRFIVRWKGGSAGDKFEVQVRKALVSKKTWHKAAVTDKHRATIRKVGTKKVSADTYYLVRVRIVNDLGAGGWTVLLVHTPKEGAAASTHVYSHRGSYSKMIDAHTFKAYDRAIKQGSVNLEQDVVLSKNGTLYVSHDLTTKAITGKKQRYSNLTNKQINRLRKKNGERVHTLASVYKRYGDDITYIVELKEGSKQIKAFSRFVKRYHPKNIVVQASNLKVLNAIEKAFPNIQKLCITYTKKEMLKAMDDDTVDIIAMRIKLATPTNVRAVQRADKVASVFTVNAQPAIKRMIQRGVDTYFTRCTARALTLEGLYRK